MSNVCVISIQVPDIQKAIDFYTTVLGFSLNQRYGPKIVTLVNGDLPLVLEEVEGTQVTGQDHVSRIVLALKTENINDTVKYLKGKEVDFIVDEPTTCPPGRFVSFRDPFGNVLEFLQFN